MDVKNDTMKIEDLLDHIPQKPSFYKIVGELKKGKTSPVRKAGALNSPKRV